MGVEYAIPLNTQHLPDSIQEMAELIGLPATLKIVEERGGIRLSIPTKVNDKSWLTQLIGREAMMLLVKHYKGEELDIPRCTAAVKAAQDAHIYQQIQAGVPQSKLAREYGYTERGIRKVKHRMDKRAAMKQSCLF